MSYGIRNTVVFASQFLYTILASILLCGDTLGQSPVNLDCVAEMKGHEDKIRAIACSPDGRWIASGGFDKTIRLWDANFRQWNTKGFTSAAKYDLGSKVTSMSLGFTKDGKLLAAGLDDGVLLIDVNTGKPAKPKLQLDDAVFGVDVSPVASQVAASCSSGEVFTYDWESGTKKPLASFSEPVFSVIYEPSGSHLAYAGVKKPSGVGGGFAFSALTGGEITLRDLSMKATDHREFELGIGEVTAFLDISNDGKYLAASFVNTNIYDLKEGKVIAYFENVGGSVAFSKKGEFLAIANEQLKVFDVVTRKLKYVGKGQVGRAWSAAFTMDGSCLLTGGDDKVLRVWKVPANALGN